MSRIIVRKRGDGGSVRIPATVLKAAKISVGQAVDVREEYGRRIIIEPVCEPVYDLKTLLAGITNENRHDETDFGDLTGKEIL